MADNFNEEHEQQNAEEQAMLEYEAYLKQLEKEKKDMHTKLVQIWIDHAVGTRKTKLTSDEEKTVKKAKQFKDKQLNKDIKRIEGVIKTNKEIKKTKLKMKGMTGAPPLLTFGLYFALGLFLLIAIVVIVSAIIGGLNGLFNSIYGVSGEDFYGVRMVYEDDELASKKIIEDYVELVEKSVDEIQGINSVTVGENTYSVAIQLEITLPRDVNEGEGYNFDEYDEATFQTEYSLVYNIVLEMAKSTYKADYEHDEENSGAEYAGQSLLECVNGIKYFGIGNADEIKTILTTNTTSLLTNIQLVSVKDSAGTDVADESVKTEILNQIKTDATAKIDAVVEANSARARKLFVKDYILEGDEDRVSGVESQQYVAIIFMPKSNVMFSKLSFVIGETDLNEFSISVNDKELETDEENVGIEEGQQAYIYSTKLIFSETANEFTDIDTNNLNALSEGVSLFDILSMENVDPLTYLVELDGVYTLKANGVVVKVENDTPFNIVEYETNWVDTIG